MPAQEPLTQTQRPKPRPLSARGHVGRRSRCLPRAQIPVGGVRRRSRLHLDTASRPSRLPPPATRCGCHSCNASRRAGPCRGASYRRMPPPRRFAVPHPAPCPRSSRTTTSLQWTTTRARSLTRFLSRWLRCARNRMLCGLRRLSGGGLHCLNRWLSRRCACVRLRAEGASGVRGAWRAYSCLAWGSLFDRRSTSRCQVR